MLLLVQFALDMYTRKKDTLTSQTHHDNTSVKHDLPGYFSTDSTLPQKPVVAKDNLLS